MVAVGRQCRIGGKHIRHHLRRGLRVVRRICLVPVESTSIVQGPGAWVPKNFQQVLVSFSPSVSGLEVLIKASNDTFASGLSKVLSDSMHRE